MRLIAFLRGEPAVIGSVVAAAVGLGAAFGLSLSAEQAASITSVITVIIGVLIRAQVTPASVSTPEIPSEDFAAIAPLLPAEEEGDDE